MPHRVWAHQPKVLASEEGHEFFGEIGGAWGRERAPQPRCGARGFSVVAPRAHSPTISSSRSMSGTSPSSMSGADHLVPSSTLAPRSMSPQIPVHVQHPPPAPCPAPAAQLHVRRPPPHSKSDAGAPLHVRCPPPHAWVTSSLDPRRLR